MFAKLIAIALLVAVTLGCCWAENPETPIASDDLMQAYRETALSRECNHIPYRCMRPDYHAQRLVLDELCHDVPPCTRVIDCLKNHIELVYQYGCFHTPKCPSAISHYNAIRTEQGLKPIDVRSGGPLHNLHNRSRSPK